MDEVVTTTDEVLTDDILAAQFRSQADRMSKEAAALRRQAEDLVPTVKKQKLLKLLRRLSLVSINDGKLHPDVVKVWPEIFKDIQVRTIPLEYLEAILVTFLDGKTWEIAIDATKKEPTSTK